MSPAMEQGDNFRTLVTKLRKERGLTLEDLGLMARQRAADKRSVSLSLLQKRIAPKNRKAPSAALLEAVADVLRVPPETFPEYQLYLARRRLDQEAVGLDAALENLERVREALGLDGGAVTSRAADDEGPRVPGVRPGPRPRRDTQRHAS